MMVEFSILCVDPESSFAVVSRGAYLVDTIIGIEDISAVEGRPHKAARTIVLFRDGRTLGVTDSFDRVAQKIREASR